MTGQSRATVRNGTAGRNAWPAESFVPFRALTLAATLLAGTVTAADRKSAADAGKAEASVADASLAEQLKAVFDSGFVVGPSHLKEAEKLVAQARKLAPSDARLDYALGLVCLKQSQIKPAIVRFDAAVKRGDAPWWPAWQALIWAQFVDKRYDQGFKTLEEFAGIVGQAEKPGEVSDKQRDAARWIGQFFESLLRCDELKKLREQVVGHEPSLREALGDELAESLEVGREAIREREVESGRGSDATYDSLEQTRKRRKQESADALDKNLEEAKKTKETAKKTTDEWKKWITDTLPKFDKQLAQLERNYQDLEKQATACQESYVNTGRLLTSFTISQPPPGTDVVQMRTQMEAARLQYNVLIGRMSDLSQQATLTIQQRAQAIEEYETATGDLVQKNAKLDKWTSRLNDKKQKLAAQKPGARAGNKAHAEKNSHLSLKTFFPLDLEGQRDRLMASFGRLGEAGSDRAAGGGK